MNFVMVLEVSASSVYSGGASGETILVGINSSGRLYVWSKKDKMWREV